ncbi:catechol 2,3-dioxygenase [Thermogemmatispora tikiterensis]|uniref:Catechol 2,3-dioxygenase n=1 Tax=Thermogemmatispora tikiterensis TaxID=1825093 RepID=A0A328V992_9CHLR|nr:catechol 2,3-dioxygenase [Thermogemmatispora tikiterensis]
MVFSYRSMDVLLALWRYAPSHPPPSAWAPAPRATWRRLVPARSGGQPPRLLREHIMLNDGTEAGAWLSVSALMHEIALMGDRSGGPGAAAPHLLLVRLSAAPLRHC